MKHLPEDYQPKGYLNGFPLNIIDKMIDEQVTQGNHADVTVFENDAGQNKKGGGFDWSLSRQKEEYWQEVIGRRNFDYPDPTEQIEDFANKHTSKFKPISEDLKQSEPPSEEMSKRFYAALAISPMVYGAMMQQHGFVNIVEVISQSYKFADELIRQEETK
jgi:hypothetical protein